MSTGSESVLPGAAEAAGTAEADARQARRARLLERARALKHAYLQVFGIPDYEAYLAHMAARHPGKEVLSRKAFFDQAIERKYCRRGMPCC